MNLKVYSHFHKEFPVNRDSSWLVPTFAASSEEYGHLSLPSGYTNVTAFGGGINKFKWYYSSKTDEDGFLKAMGQQATEYWMLDQNPTVDYIGCSTYRRYLMVDPEAPKNVSKIIMPPEQENADRLGSDEMGNIILQYMETADVLTNHSIAVNHSVESQYLESQPREYWDKFLEAIDVLYPDYRKHLTWFKQCSIINFETCYVMRRQVFRKYATELFEILEYIFKNSSNVYPTQQTTSEPLPWRYPGFLGERFFPFFVYANGLRRIQVPLVVLQ
jgi:hypothetical protein